MSCPVQSLDITYWAPVLTSQMHVHYHRQKANLVQPFSKWSHHHRKNRSAYRIRIIQLLRKNVIQFDNVPVSPIIKHNRF
uniref:Uncharacterized protein n=1 Tax=Oryza brachyantha TaxID=4533 RepID=J3MKU7_ORYBR